MSKSFGTKLWSLLNTRIIIVIIVMVLLPFVATYSATFFIEKVTERALSATEEVSEDFSSSLTKYSKEKKKKALKELNIYKKIKIKNVKTVPSNWKSDEKVIGTIVNNSNKTLQSIHLKASFYDKNGKLIDVIDEWLHGMKFVLPKEKVNFSFKRGLGTQEESKEVLSSRKSFSVKVRVRDFSILDTKKETN